MAFCSKFHSSRVDQTRTTCMRLCTGRHMYMHADMYVCMYCAHTHTHARTHTHTHTPNGCLLLPQVDISDFPHMHKCCDEHDKCYDTCNQDKIECDSKFHSCLNQDCKRLQSRLQKECSNAANIMYTGVAVFGCQFYLQSQKQACDCSHLPKTSGRLKRDL